MTIKPIKTEEDYLTALKVIDSLGDPEEGTEAFDTLDILVTLVEAYEAKHYPISPPDPISAIEYEMEKRGLTRKDLERVIGPSGRVSEVLARQRPLTVTMIRSLNRTYRIAAEILITEYPLNKEKRVRKAKKSAMQVA